MDGPRTNSQVLELSLKLHFSTLLVFNALRTTPMQPKESRLMAEKETGKYGKLTADTTLESSGRLVAEYIINGKNIKLGKGTAGPAAAGIASDLVRYMLCNSASGYQLTSYEQVLWNPKEGDTVDIADSPCNPWTIGLDIPLDQILWSRQVTAAMPLAAINNLMLLAESGSIHALLPFISSQKSNMKWIQSSFFQSSPMGISANGIDDDALGFFALVLAYAKSADNRGPADSPKKLTSIMPRTDFVNMFNMVRPSIVGYTTGSLYGIVKILACYTNTEIENGASDIE